MKSACAYAVIQFRPFVETGEFANVGVVLMDVEHRFMDFRLIRKYSRVTRFFAELERKVYLEAMSGFRDELERLRGYIRREALDGRRKTADVGLAQRLFAELTRTREGLVRFDHPRVILAEDPAARLEALFEHYVGRNFVTREYQERLLENRIGRLLYRAHLPFSSEKVGDDDFQVRFPFVQKKDNVVAAVIKPLYLGQDDSTQILTKGDGWISKVARLRRIRQLPEHVLFALDGPSADRERQFRAFEDIRVGLMHQAVTVVTASNDDEILRFAGGSGTAS